MSATATRSKRAQGKRTNGSSTREPVTREQASRLIGPLLSDEPQAASHLAIRAGVDQRNVLDAMGVLEAEHKAQRIPNTAGSKSGGWVRYDAERERALEHPETFEFPYEFAVVEFDKMFVDRDYQRPLTSFATRIEKRFDPVLFQVLTLSDRGVKYGRQHSGKRHALIDGQTRWVAGGRRGIQRGPSVVFTGLSPEDEARIFWRLQKERRGMMSWHRFRAQLRSGDPESIAIAQLAKDVGYELGDSSTTMKAVAALEYCYRHDPFQLERTLSDLREAWPKIIPEGRYIRGLFYFFRHFPIDETTAKTTEVDDEKLVRRLRAVGPDGLLERQMATRKIKKGNSEKLMGLAVQSAYLIGGR